MSIHQNATVSLTSPPTGFSPLSASSSGRFLQHADGTPVPILGRAAWSLMKLSQADYQSFIDDTVAKGLNAIEMNLIDRGIRTIGRPFCGNGSAPFTKSVDGAAWSGAMTGSAADFTFPNETYWSFIDGILTYALTKGVLVFAFPAYVGQSGNASEGWMLDMAANGDTKMQTYGAFVADRYKLFPNIIWMLGGDYGTGGGTNDFSAPQLAAEKAMLAGMQSVGGQASSLISATWATESIYTTIVDATLKAAGSLQGAYSWIDVPGMCRSGYSASPTLPTCLVEGPYDQEGPDGTNVNSGASAPYRRYQWWGWLSSIGGYISGNGFVWMFTDGDWQAHLNTQCTQDNARMNAFMQTLQWWTLVPDGLGSIGTLITAGKGSGNTLVTAAANPAGTLFLAYRPPAHAGTFTVDMTKMSAAAKAQWFDPTNASLTLDSASIANSGTHVFTAPGNNSAGQTDWTLILVPA